MGVFDRFEKGIERAVNGAFAKAFRVRGAAGRDRERRAPAATTRPPWSAAAAPWCPTRSSSSSARPTTTGCEYEDELGRGARHNLREHAERAGYAFVGPVTVEFEEVARSTPACSGSAAADGQGREAAPARRRRRRRPAASRRQTRAASGTRPARRPVARHRRPRLPADSRGPWSAAATTPTSCSTTPASPAGTPRSGSPPTARTWSPPARPRLDQRHLRGRRADRPRRARHRTATGITVGRTRATFRSGDRDERAHRHHHPARPAGPAVGLRLLRRRGAARRPVRHPGHPRAADARSRPPRREPRRRRAQAAQPAKADNRRTPARCGRPRARCAARRSRWASSPCLIGRSPGSTLVLDDDYASGRHARIFPQDGEWFVEDLGSTNGTYLAPTVTAPAAGRRRRPTLQIGTTVLELRR